MRVNDFSVGDFKAALLRDSVFLAYLLDPLVRLLRYCRVPLALAVCFALLVTFVFLALMGMLFYASAQSFVREYPTHEPKLRALLTTLTSRVEVAPELSWQLSDLFHCHFESRAALWRGQQGSIRKLIATARPYFSAARRIGQYRGSP